jgi:hypothetical protein
MIDDLEFKNISSQNQQLYGHLHAINDEENASVVLKDLVRSLMFNHDPKSMQSPVKPNTLSLFGRGLMSLEFDGKSIEIFSRTDTYLNGLKSLLDNCRDSLRSLNIGFENISHFKEVVKHFPAMFTKMENLTVEFAVHFHGDQEIIDKFKTVFFKFPNLSFLSLKGIGAEEMLRILLRSLPPFRNRLTRFHCDLGYGRRFPIDFRIFPNVTELSLSAFRCNQLKTFLDNIQPLEQLETIILDLRELDDMIFGQTFDGQDFTNCLLSLQSIFMKKIFVGKDFAAAWKPSQQILTELKDKFAYLEEGELTNSVNYSAEAVNILSLICHNE